MIQAVIFDKDGVLLDSTGIHIDAVVAAFRQHAIELDGEDIANIAGRRPEDYYGDFAEKYRFDADDLRGTQREKYYALLKDAPLMEGTVRILEHFKNKDYLVGLTTSANRRATDDMMVRHNLHGIFDAIVTSEDCPKKKPDPFPYTLTAQRLNVCPEDCLVIEDSEAGVISAKRALTKCIAVPTRYTCNQDFSCADYVFDSLHEIDFEHLRFD